MEDVNCFTIASATCKGMWKDKQYMLGIEQGLHRVCQMLYIAILDTTIICV